MRDWSTFRGYRRLTDTDRRVEHAHACLPAASKARPLDPPAVSCHRAYFCCALAYLAGLSIKRPFSE